MLVTVDVHANKTGVALTRQSCNACMTDPGLMEGRTCRWVWQDLI